MADPIKPNINVGNLCPVRSKRERAHRLSSKNPTTAATTAPKNTAVREGDSMVGVGA